MKTVMDICINPHAQTRVKTIVYTLLALGVRYQIHKLKNVFERFQCAQNFLKSPTKIACGMTRAILSPGSGKYTSIGVLTQRVKKE